MAAGGGYEKNVVHRMNEEYRAWGALKRILNNRVLGINAKKCKPRLGGMNSVKMALGGRRMTLDNERMILRSGVPL